MSDRGDGRLRETAGDGLLRGGGACNVRIESNRAEESRASGWKAPGRVPSTVVEGAVGVPTRLITQAGSAVRFSLDPTRIEDALF